MGTKERSSATMAAMAHRHYQTPFTGDGATVEFALPHTIDRQDDLIVFSAGKLMVAASQGTANDYAVRGFTPGYKGDKNRVKFSSAPGNGVVGVFITAGG